MSKVYTKTGDKGLTGLVSGQRVSKSDFRLETYGEVDHLNSMIGALIQHLNSNKIFNDDSQFLENIQNKLFNLGSLLACPTEERAKFKLTEICEDDVNAIEKRIDLIETELPPLSNFILPGGSLPASYAHLCRTQARNLERLMVKNFKDLNELPENSLMFINRLSDYFFDLARVINVKLKVKETIWKS